MNGKPANMSDRERYPNLVDDIGYDPARFLDRELIETGPGHTDRSGKRLFVAVVRGIPTLTTVNAWIAVERSLERGPRDYVLDLLYARQEYLEEHGDRELPDEERIEELRERNRERYEAIREAREDDQEGDEPLTAAQKLHRLRTSDEPESPNEPTQETEIATDGGVDQGERATEQDGGGLMMKITNVLAWLAMIQIFLILVAGLTIALGVLP